MLIYVFALTWRTTDVYISFEVAVGKRRSRFVCRWQCWPTHSGEVPFPPERTCARLLGFNPATAFELIPPLPSRTKKKVENKKGGCPLTLLDRKKKSVVSVGAQLLKWLKCWPAAPGRCWHFRQTFSVNFSRKNTDRLQRKQLCRCDFVKDFIFVGLMFEYLCPIYSLFYLFIPYRAVKQCVVFDFGEDYFYLTSLQIHTAMPWSWCWSPVVAC